jgi:uncharacterized protein (TIGR02421 family)
LNRYRNAVRELGDRLVEAQRPIRILDAIKWDDDTERDFFAVGARELPAITPATYDARPLPFDPAGKHTELAALARGVRRRLGGSDPAGRILARMCEEYREVVDLLVSRGTPAFHAISQRLFGATAHRSRPGEPSLADLGQVLAGTLDNLARDATLGREPPTLDARTTVAVLSERLGRFFGAAGPVRVKLSDGIIADAAAGGDYLKIRGEARFTPRDVRLLEVHEGWVHLGTTLNGQRQPVCTFLSKGPPSSTVTQEGLAVLTELLAFASHPARVRRLTHRIEGVGLAEAGADFLEVYRFFLEEGYEPRESYQHTVRIFRGSLPRGCGPFTKDLAYSKGFVQVAAFLRQAVACGEVGRVPLLFCGKTNVDDMPTLAHLADAGLLAPPRFIPPPFADLHALSAWMCFGHLLAAPVPVFSAPPLAV